MCMIVSLYWRLVRPKSRFETGRLMEMRRMHTGIKPLEKRSNRIFRARIMLAQIGSTNHDGGRK